MSQPPLESTPIGTNTTNITTSNLNLTPIGEKMPDPKLLKRPTNLSKLRGEVQVPEYLESDPPLLDSLLIEYD